MQMVRPRGQVVVIDHVPVDVLFRVRGRAAEAGDGAQHRRLASGPAPTGPRRTPA